jgi:hypothetical protein
MKKRTYQLVNLIIVSLLLVTAASCKTVENTPTYQRTLSSKPSIPPGNTALIVHPQYPIFTLDQLINNSTVIVRCRAVEYLTPQSTNDPIRPGETMIYTNILLDVQEHLLGESESVQIAVCMRGGTIGDLTVWVEDEDIFILGQEVVLFLAPAQAGFDPPDGINQADYYRVRNSSQGQFIVQGDMLTDVFGKTMSMAELKQKIADLRGN